MKTNAGAARIRRHFRVRRKVTGRADRPRLSVFRSLRHIHAQVIDDKQGRTLAAASSLEKELPAAADGDATGKRKQAALVGTLVAQRAKAQGVSRVVFDRGGYQYHGRVKALADAARAAGLEF